MQDDHFINEGLLNNQPVEQKKSTTAARKTLIGAGSVLGVAAMVAVAMSGKETEKTTQVEEPLTLSEEKSSQCTIGNEAPWKIEETCGFSVNRFRKQQSLDIFSDEFKCQHPGYKVPVPTASQCKINENDNKMGPNRCNANNECQGNRTCSNTHWCQGYSACGDGSAQISLIDADVMYEDPSFPATVQGMMVWAANDNRGLTNELKYVEPHFGLSFKRPTEIPAYQGGSPTPSLWGKKGVRPDAIVQGDIGDCWFLSNLASIAQTPSRIHSMFGNKEYADNGAFQVNFWVEGKQQQVIIDDRLPVVDEFKGKKDGLYAARVTKTDEAWWPVLVEKAAAKLYTTYGGLSSGMGVNALKVMTGKPCTSWGDKEVKAMTNEELWGHIMEGTNNNWPMSSGTGNSVPNYLMPNHGYSVLRGLQLKKPDGSDGPKLIQMMNPHGNSRYNYTGPWKESSHNWTESYRKQCDFNNQNHHGIFWEPLEKFANDFAGGLNVAHWDDNWHVAKVEGNKFFLGKNYGTEYLNLHNPVEQDIYMECAQYQWRMFPRGEQQCQAKPANFSWNVFSEQSSNQWQDRNGQVNEHKQGCNENALVMKNLPAGHYTIPISTYGNKGKDSTFGLTAWATKQPITMVNDPSAAKMSQQMN